MKDLTRGNLSKNLLFFALPSIFSGLFSYALNIVDQMMLGKLAGNAGLAAAGCTGGYFSVIWGILGGLGFGFGIRLTYLVGTGDHTKTRQTIRTNTVVSLSIGLVILALTWILQMPILRLMKVPGDIFEEARRYYLIYSLLLPAFFLRNGFTRVFSSFGNATYPMRVSLGMTLGNVVLNFLFIVVFRMGAAGAALASVIVSYVALAAEIWGVLGELRKMGGELRGWHFSLADYKPIWLLAVPCLLQQVAIYMGDFLLQPAINSLGTTTLAAVSVGHSISNLVNVAFDSTAVGVSVLVGQAIGGRRVSIIKRGLRISVRQILLFSLPVIALLLIFPRLGAFLFLADPYGESAMIVIRYMYVCVPCLLFSAYARMFHNFFRGAMKPVFNTAASVTQCAVRVLLAFLLIPRMGYMGLFIANGASFAADLLVCLVLYWSRRWKTLKYLNAEREERESLAQAAV